MGWLLVPVIWLVSSLEGAPPRDSLRLCMIFLILYYVMRIFANVFMDRDAEAARIENSRRHFGRPSFRMWNDANGIHIESGPNPDHATRCQNSLREWYQVERRLKWNNWIYMGWIVLLYLAIDRI